MPESERTSRRPRRRLIVSGIGVIVAGAMKIVRIASLVALVYAAVGPSELATGLGLALIGSELFRKRSAPMAEEVQ